MKLTRFEQETVILYNNAEPFATIDTCDDVLIRRLETLAEKSPDITRENKTEYGARYKIPKRYLSVKLPRQLSEERRAELAKRAKANFERRVNE